MDMRARHVSRAVEYQHLQPAGAARIPFEKADALLRADHTTVSRKENGWRELMHFGGSCSRTYLTGRRITKSTGLFRECGLCVPMLGPKKRDLAYTVLDGEVIHDTLPRRQMASLLNVSPEQAAETIKKFGPPRFVAFDALFFAGKDLRNLPQKERVLWLHRCFEMGYRSQHMSIVMRRENHKEQFYEEEVSAGGEGVIIEDTTAIYGEGWWKLKKFYPIDTVIMGFTDANEGKTGKFLGLIGAIEVGVYRSGRLVKVAQVSGMPDDVRRAVTKNKKAYLNQVLEVKAQEFDKNKLLHPRYGQFRPDLNASDCTWAKMVADLEASKGDADKDA